MPLPSSDNRDPPRFCARTDQRQTRRAGSRCRDVGDTRWLAASYSTRGGNDDALRGGRRTLSCNTYLFGWGVRRRYGLRVVKPLGNFTLASLSEIAGEMMTSSPSFQFTGVDTPYCALSCSASSARMISSTLRPISAG